MTREPLEPGLFGAPRSRLHARVHLQSPVAPRSGKEVSNRTGVVPLERPLQV